MKFFLYFSSKLSFDIYICAAFGSVKLPVGLLPDIIAIIFFKVLLYSELNHLFANSISLLFSSIILCDLRDGLLS